MTKKILIWAPHKGKVGTTAAALNYYSILETKGYSCSFLALTNEWDGYAVNKIRLIKPDSLFFKVGTTNFFRRRDYFILPIIFFFRLKRILNEHDGAKIISMLLSIPVALGVNDKSRVYLSVQGLPKFLLNTDQNIFYKTEDGLRRLIWKKLYQGTEILTMTSFTRLQLKDNLKLESKVLPNPLFKDLPIAYDNYRDTGEINFVFIGRNTYQKNIFGLLKYFARYSFLYPNSKLHIYGFKDELMPSLHWHNKVHYYGFVNDPWEAVNDMTNVVHLVPSHWEDPGHAIIEGLVRGVHTVLNVNAVTSVSTFSGFVPLVKFIDFDSDEDQISGIMRTSEVGHFESLRRTVFHKYSFEQFSNDLNTFLG